MFSFIILSLQVVDSNGKHARQRREMAKDVPLLQQVYQLYDIGRAMVQQVSCGIARLHNTVDTWQSRGANMVRHATTTWQSPKFFSLLAYKKQRTCFLRSNLINNANKAKCFYNQSKGLFQLLWTPIKTLVIHQDERATDIVRSSKKRGIQGKVVCFQRARKLGNQSQEETSYI